MPAQISQTGLELWDGLNAVSGKVRLYAGVRWSALELTTREDGDDVLRVTLALTEPAAAGVTTDYVWRVIGEDATVLEFIILTIDESVEDDTMTMTCAAARSWLNTTAITPNAETWIGNAANHAARIATWTGFPAWLTIGTVVSTASLTVGYTSDDTALSAMMKLVGVIDATLASGATPCVMRFRRASDSSYVIDILTTATTGTAVLWEGKNLRTIGRTRDKTSGTAITSYRFEVVDGYRVDAAAYPLDKLTCYETARFVSASLAVDTSVRVSELVTDFATNVTRVQLGEPRRRLVRETEAVAAGANPPNPVLTVTPGAVTGTTQVYTYAATITAGTLSYRVLCRGTTGSASTTGALADGTSAPIVAGETLTITRPTAGSPAATMQVSAFGSGGGGANTLVNIEAQVAAGTVAPTLEVAVTVSSTTYSAAYTSTGTVEKQTDAGGYTSAGATPVVFTRPTAGSDPNQCVIRASLNGLYAYYPMTVQPQGSGSVPASVDYVYANNPSTGADTFDVTFAYSNAPSGFTLDVEWSHNANGGSSGTITGISTTSPYSLNTSTYGGVDIVTSGTSGATLFQYTTRLLLRNSGGTLLATGTDTINLYYVP